MTLLKSCTGARCTRREVCYLYDPKPTNPFNCISPLDRHDECPYFAEKVKWGELSDKMGALE